MPPESPRPAISSAEIRKSELEAEAFKPCMANKFLPCMSMLREAEISILSNWTASASGMAGVCAGIPCECLIGVASGNLSAVEIGSKAVVIPNVQHCRANVFDLATECKRDPDVAGRIPGVHAFFEVKD